MKIKFNSPSFLKLPLLFAFVLSFEASAQTQFFLQGNATNSGGGCYQITTATNGQAGMATNLYQIDLSKTFSLTFTMDLGSQAAGADGMTFAINKACSPTLGGGQGLGTSTSMTPSIICEFDTHQNTTPAGVDDPAPGPGLDEDHIGFYYNGVVSMTSNQLPGCAGGAIWQSPTSFSAVTTHTIIISWTAGATQTLSVSFDGTVRKTATGNYLSSIFGGTNLQYWSITGSTGAKNNNQSFCYVESNQNQSSACAGGSFTFIAPTGGTSYTWTPTPADNSITGNGTYSIQATPVVTTTYTATYNDGCSVPRTINFIGTVQNAKPDGTISPTATAVCKNAASPNITFTKTAGTSPLKFVYTINGGATQTVTAAGASTTIAVPTNAVGIFTYSLVSIIDGSGSNCSNFAPSNASGSTTVTVNPLPNASATPSTICSGQTVNIPLSADITSTFTWQAANNPNTTGESTVSKSTNTINDVITITTNTTSVQTVTYSITPTSTPQGCQGSTQIVQVTVNPLPTITVTPTATVCSGTQLNKILSANQSSTYTWKASPNPNTTGQSTTSQSGNTINDLITITTNTATAQTVTYTVIPTSTSSCTGAPQVITITINPLPSVTNTDKTICSGNSVNMPLAANLTSAFTWIAATNGSTTGQSTTGQSTSTINDIITNNSVIPQTVTYTVTPTTTPQGCAGSSQLINITVNPLPQGSFTGNSRCVSDPSQLGYLTWTAAAGSNNYTVNFTGPVTQNNVLSGTSFSVSPSGTPTLTTTYTLTSVTDANSCTRFSGFTIPTATITVTGAPISIQAGTPASKTTCSGIQTSFVVKATNVNSYSWQASTDNGSSWTTILAPGTSPIYSNYTTDSLVVSNATVANRGYKYRSIMNPACGLADTSTVATLTVDTIPVLTSPKGKVSTVCSGSSVTYTPTSSVSGTNTFSWTRAAVIGITGGAASGTGAINEILTNTTTSPIDVTYNYITTSPKSCSNSGENIIITINPNANIVLTSPVGTDNQHVCLNDTIVHIAYTFNEGAIGATVNGLPTGLITSVNSNIVTITGTAQQEGVFNYTVNTTGNCIQTSITGTLTVGLSLSSAPKTDTQSVCKNSPITTITYAIGSGSASVLGLPPGVAGVNSSGVFTISGTPTVAGTYDYTVSTQGV